MAAIVFILLFSMFGSFGKNESDKHLLKKNVCITVCLFRLLVSSPCLTKPKPNKVIIQLNNKHPVI